MQKLSALFFCALLLFSLSACKQQASFKELVNIPDKDVSTLPYFSGKAWYPYPDNEIDLSHDESVLLYNALSNYIHSGKRISSPSQLEHLKYIVMDFRDLDPQLVSSIESRLGRFIITKNDEIHVSLTIGASYAVEYKAPKGTYEELLRYLSAIDQSDNP